MIMKVIYTLSMIFIRITSMTASTFLLINLMRHLTKIMDYLLNILIVEVFPIILIK